MKEHTVLPSNVHLYIGSLVKHNSEREILKLLCTALARLQGKCFIFANFQVSGRQIDFLVATPDTTFIIEAKSSSRPMKGEINGHWEMIGPGTQTKKVTNGYEQTLNAKNALHSFMQTLLPNFKNYADAAVIYVPRIPKNSELTKGDYKVRVSSFDSLADLFVKSHAFSWPANLWQKFISALKLEHISDIKAAVSEEFYEAINQYETYTKAFIAYYKPTADRIFSDTYTIDGSVVDTNRIESFVLEEGNDVLIIGPSGCGKSLLARCLAIDSITRNYVPIIIEAKNFDGSLRESIKNEILLLNSENVLGFWQSVKKLEKPLLLVVDGYNECPRLFSQPLLRRVHELVKRNIAHVVFTSQYPLDRPDYFPVTRIQVSKPSLSLKAAIARIGLSNPANENILNLLDTVSSGLEAGIVGDVRENMPTSSSRFALFDAYVRSQLEGRASEGINLLSALAGRLLDGASFSMSLSEYERLVSAQNIPLIVTDVIRQSKLLDYRMGRVSFIHEMFHSYFGAEALIRAAKNSLEALASVVLTPRFNSYRPMIIGALDDTNTLHSLINIMPDPELLKACIEGTCGEASKAIVTKKLGFVLRRIREEAEHVEFKFGDDFRTIETKRDTLKFDSSEASLYVTVIANELLKGNYFEEVMDIIKIMDKNFATTYQKLLPIGKEKQVSVKTPLFSAMYSLSPTAIGSLLMYIHSGSLGFLREMSETLVTKVDKAWLTANSYGEYYFLIGLMQGFDKRSFAASRVLYLLRNSRSYPYHLKLEILELTRSFYAVDEPLKSEFVEALQSALSDTAVILNSLILEILGSFGALFEDCEKYTETVVREIESVLLGPDTGETKEKAWHIYSAQFDHPYDIAFYEVINALSEDKKKELYVRASEGVPEHGIFFVSTLVQRLSECRGDDVVEALKKWTKLPAPGSVFPQEGMEAFIEAYCAFQRLGEDLPEIQEDLYSPEELVVISCGELFYLSCQSVQDDLYHQRVARIEARLFAPDQRSAVGTLKMCSQRFSLSKQPLVQLYPDLSLKLSRRALLSWQEQANYFLPDFPGQASEIAVFAIGIIEARGNAEDLLQLRELCNEPRLSSSALSAIRTIEERVNFTAPR